MSEQLWPRPRRHVPVPIATSHHVNPGGGPRHRPGCRSQHNSHQPTTEGHSLQPPGLPRKLYPLEFSDKLLHVNSTLTGHIGRFTIRASEHLEIQDCQVLETPFATNLSTLRLETEASGLPYSDWERYLSSQRQSQGNCWSWGLPTSHAHEGAEHDRSDFIATESYLGT